MMIIISDHNDSHHNHQFRNFRADVSSRMQLGVKRIRSAMQTARTQRWKRFVTHFPETRVFNDSLRSAIDWGDVAIFDSSSAGIKQSWVAT